jgi:hypothetical protein
MRGEGGEGVRCTHACAAERKSDRRRRGCRAGGGAKRAKRQQKTAVAPSCKAFLLLFVFVGSIRNDGGEGVGCTHAVLFLFFVSKSFCYMLFFCIQFDIQSSFSTAFDPMSQSGQTCGPFGYKATSSLMRICRYNIRFTLDCSDWKGCVESDSWVSLPRPPPEVLDRGTWSVVAYVQAMLTGGDFSRSCRVMVVGPQMVRAHTRIVYCVLTAAAGGQDQPD